MHISFMYIYGVITGLAAGIALSIVFIIGCAMTTLGEENHDDCIEKMKEAINNEECNA